MGIRRSRQGWAAALLASGAIAAILAPGRLGASTRTGAAVAAPSALPPGRPRVCLVLSGGGARGMAHIGVLRVIEELKVPIDCIAGTSMGAVVGGLYASG